MYIKTEKIAYRCDYCKRETPGEGPHKYFPTSWIEIRKGASSYHVCSFKCGVYVLSRFLLLPGWKQRMARRMLQEEGEE